MACVSGATLPIVHSLSSLDISTQNRSFNGALCEPSPSSSSFFSNPSKLLLSRKRRKRIILVHVASEILAYGHKECRRNDAPLKSNGWADEYLSTKRSSRVMREDRGDIPRVPCRRETRVVKVSAIHQSRGAKYTKFSYKSGGYNKANQGQKVDLLSGILSDDDPYQSSITRKRNPRVPLPTENQQSRLHNEVCPYESVKNPRAITKRADGHSSQRHASDDSSLSIKQHSLNFPMQRRETQPIPGKGALFMSKLETVLADLEVESDSLRGSFSDTTAGGEFRSASIDHSGDVFHDLTCQGKEQQVEETSQLTYAEGARSAELSDLGNSVHGRSLAAGEDDSIMIGHRKDLQNTNILYTQKLEKSAKVNDSGFIPFNLFPNLPSVPWEADRTYPSPPKNTHKKGMTSVRYAPTSIGSRSTPSQRSASKWGGKHPRFDSLLTSDLDDAAKFNKVGAKQSLLTDDILGQADMVRTLVASHKEKPSYIKHTRSYLKLDPEAVRSNTSALRSINGGKIMGSGSLVIGELQLKNKDKTIHQNGFQGTEKQVEDLDFESSDSDIKEDDHAYSDSDSVRDKDTASKPSKSVAGDTDNCPVAAGNMDGRIGNNSSANLAMDGKNSSNSSMIIAADGNVGVHHISDSKSLPTHATWQKHSMPDLPFDFQFSYTETPNAPVLKYRETPFSPFGPSTIGRPWIGGRPHNPSKKKKIVFDSFKPPPKDMKGVKHVQDPGPYPEGQGPKVARSREEIMGDPLTKEEIVYLVEKCKREKRQLNLGRDGLTHNMLDSIHSHWKRRRVCRIKCKGVPTVDMENVKFHIEDKTGGKIIYQTGGVLYLFRGRNYNYKDRPQIPLMLWKPATPVYPNLIQPAPEGLTAEEAKKLRKLGMKVRPICKLGKNGVYLDLVNEVKAAFKVDDLVRVDCQGLKPSDYKRIGAKLKDLVPCVLLSFEKEHILMWKGKEYSTDSRSEAPALEGTTDGDNKNFKLSVLLENPSKVESHFNANISVSLAVDLNPCCEHPHHSNLSYEEAHDRSVKPLDLAQNIEETGEENMSTDEDNEGDNSNPNTHQIIGELTSSIQCSLMNTSDNDAESLTTPSLRSSFNQAGHCSPDELMPSENRPSSDSVHQHEDYEDEPMLIGCPSDTSVHQQDCGDEEFALSEVPSMSITHHGKDLKGKKILVSEKSSSNDVMQDLIKEYGILARNKTLDEKIINDELTWMVDVNSLWEHALESGMAIEQKDMDPDLIIRKADELAQLAPLAPSYTTKLMYKLQIKRNSYTQLKDEPQIYFGRVLYKNKKPKKVKHKYELPTVGAPPIGRLPVDELAKYLVKKQASEAQGSESLSVPLC